MTDAIHILAGSSPSTGAAPTFEPIATATSAQHHPDAELIELAERVSALARRENTACCRRARIEDRVHTTMGPRPPKPEIPSGIVVTDQSTATERIMTISCPLESEPEDPRLTAWQAEVDAHMRCEKEMELRLGLPALEKRVDRMFRRLIRWTNRLAALAPQTSAGLAAKAAASVAVVEGGRHQWMMNLCVSVGHDAVRLATVQAAPSATDTALSRLASEHEHLAATRDRSWDALDRTEDAFVEIPIPDALRFREATDASSIGGYQNLDEPYNYTDERKIQQLRTCRYSRPENQHRRDEIVAAYDQWRADGKAARDAAGLPEAWDKAMADGEAASAVRRQMIDVPALTMDGVWSKVAVALSCYQSVEEIKEELAEQHANDATGETMLLSILIDLGHMLTARKAAETPSATHSNIVEVPQPVRYAPAPMSQSREIVETYRAFLDAEFRFLNWETHRSPHPMGGIWLNNPAGNFHGGDTPPPSSRAAAVLGLLGLLPEQADDHQVEPTAKVA